MVKISEVPEVQAGPALVWAQECIQNSMSAGDKAVVDSVQEPVQVSS